MDNGHTVLIFLQSINGHLYSAVCAADKVGDEDTKNVKKEKTANIQNLRGMAIKVHK